MLTSCLAALVLGIPAKIDINIRDLKDGDTITKETTIRVTVASDNPVRSVEFYVGDELREADTSTPYEFKVDPIQETDGDFKVSFVAYTTEGENTKKALKLKVDTGVSKGADYNVEQGMAALSTSKFEDAVHYGRVALKAQPGFNPARILLARAFTAMGQHDKAQQFIEDALAADPKDRGAKELLAGISLRKAFDLVVKGGDRNEAIKTMNEAMKTAATARRENLEAAMDATSPTADLKRWMDASLRASRYGEVIRIANPVFQKDPKNTDVANRLVFAMIRQFRFGEAYEALKLVEKAGALDAYGYSLYGIVCSNLHDETKADQMLAEAQGNDPDDLGLRTASAYLTMSRGRNAAMTAVVKNLSADQGQRPEVNYYVSVIQQVLGNFEDASRAFEAAVLSEPALSDAYVERGNQALAMIISKRLADAEVKYQTAVAQGFYEAALAACVDSPQALTAMALLNAQQKKSADAAKYASAAIAACPTYLPGQFVGSMALDMADKSAMGQASALREKNRNNLTQDIKDQIAVLEKHALEMRTRGQEAMRNARKLDPRYMEGRAAPAFNDAWTYFYRAGRLPLVTKP